MIEAQTAFRAVISVSPVKGNPPRAGCRGTGVTHKKKKQGQGERRIDCFHADQVIGENAPDKPRGTVKHVPCQS